MRQERAKHLAGWDTDIGKAVRDIRYLDVAVTTTARTRSCEPTYSTTGAELIEIFTLLRQTSRPAR
jgi:hypothetical protein